MTLFPWEEFAGVRMIAALIAVFSLLALPPLLVSYCGTVASSARRHEPSERAKLLVGASGRDISTDDFPRILELVRLCPEAGENSQGVRTVARYYRFLGAFAMSFGSFSPGVARWASRERTNCAHFAAVTLDRCISYNTSRLFEPAEGKLP